MTRDPERLEKLSWFQRKLLGHALSFPNVRRVSYSTCSVYKEENEMVVEAVLKEHSDTFRLSKALPSWPRRGDADFDFSDLVIRCDPQKDLCNGFFVAVFERISEKKKAKKSKKRKANE